MEGDEVGEVADGGAWRRERRPAVVCSFVFVFVAVACVRFLLRAAKTRIARAESTAAARMREDKRGRRRGRGRGRKKRTAKRLAAFSLHQSASSFSPFHATKRFLSLTCVQARRRRAREARRGRGERLNGAESSPGKVVVAGRRQRRNSPPRRRCSRGEPRASRLGGRRGAGTHGWRGRAHVRERALLTGTSR